MNLIQRLLKNPTSVRKFIAALIGAVAIAVSNGLLPAQVSDYVEVIMPFATAYGVYRVYNSNDPLDNSGEKH